jgi:hypothetical protein
MRTYFGFGLVSVFLILFLFGRSTVWSAISDVKTDIVPKIALVNIGDEDAGGWALNGDSSTENLTRLSNAGVNSIAVWIGWPRGIFVRSDWWNDANTIAVLEGVGHRCKKAHVDLFYVLYLGMEKSAYPDVGLAESKDMKGEGEGAVSWLDPNFWHKVLIPRDKAIARLASRGLVQGILLEPEVYKPGALMERGQIDFGDGAYLRFSREIGMKKEAPPAKDRANQLLTSGLIGAYLEWQMKELEQFAKEWREEIRVLAPSIKLGYYNPGPWHSAWPIRSLARGMYDGHQPLLILDASTYPCVGKSWTLGWEIESIPEYSKLLQTLLDNDWHVKAHLAFGIDTYSGKFDDPNNLYRRGADPNNVVKFFKDTVKNGNGWWIWNEHGDPNIILENIKASRR